MSASSTTRWTLLTIALAGSKDGSLLVSDDHNGAIYRITYKK